MKITSAEAATNIDLLRYEKVKSFFDNLNKEEFMYKDSETLFEACKEIVAKEFCSEEENREVYLENLKDLVALMNAIQPWYYPIVEESLRMTIIKIRGYGEVTLTYAMKLAYENVGKQIKTQVPWEETKKIITKQGWKLNDNGGSAMGYIMKNNFRSSPILLSKNEKKSTTDIVYIQVLY